MISYTVIILLLFSNGLVFGGVCPPAQEIKPCTCTNTSITCITTENFDLDLVFDAIAHGKRVGTDDLWFESFVLNSTRIAKLADGVFGRIAFESVELLDCDNLTCVSPLAFAGSETNMTSFTAIGTNFRTHEKDCDIFEALKNLHNLRSVNITLSNITEIPAEAFHSKIGRQSLLTTIDLSGGQGGHIAKVGKNAFSYLQDLQYIDLSSNVINRIDSYAFGFMESSKQNLFINLENNRLLGNSFGGQAFQVNGRTTELKLGANTKLQVLDEFVFEPFLMNRMNSTENNSIDLSGTPLKCSPENLWLFEFEVSLHLKSKLTNVLSNDGQVFWKHTKNECRNAKSSTKPYLV